MTNYNIALFQSVIACGETGFGYHKTARNSEHVKQLQR